MKGGTGKAGTGMKAGKGKGRKTFPIRKNKFSLEERKKALAKIKSETKCDDCGEKDTGKARSSARKSGKPLRKQLH